MCPQQLTPLGGALEERRGVGSGEVIITPPSDQLTAEPNWAGTAPRSADRTPPWSPGGDAVALVDFMVFDLSIFKP